MVLSLQSAEVLTRLWAVHYSHVFHVTEQDKEYRRAKNGEIRMKLKSSRKKSAIHMNFFTPLLYFSVFLVFDGVWQFLSLKRKIMKEHKVTLFLMIERPLNK